MYAFHFCVRHILSDVCMELASSFFDFLVYCLFLEFLLYSISSAISSDIRMGFSCAYCAFRISLHTSKTKISSNRRSNNKIAQDIFFHFIFSSALYESVFFTLFLSIFQKKKKKIFIDLSSWFAIYVRVGFWRNLLATWSFSLSFMCLCVCVCARQFCCNLLVQWIFDQFSISFHIIFFFCIRKFLLWYDSI